MFFLIGSVERLGGCWGNVPVWNYCSYSSTVNFFCMLLDQSLTERQILILYQKLYLQNRVKKFVSAHKVFNIGTSVTTPAVLANEHLYKLPGHLRLSFCYIR